MLVLVNNRFDILGFLEQIMLSYILTTCCSKFTRHAIIYRQKKIVVTIESHAESPSFLEISESTGCFQNLDKCLTPLSQRIVTITWPGPSF